MSQKRSDLFPDLRAPFREVAESLRKLRADFRGARTVGREQSVDFFEACLQILDLPVHRRADLLQGALASHLLGRQNRPSQRTVAPGLLLQNGIRALERFPDHLEQLSEAEQKVVYQLQDQDREVRAHEQAHLAAAGPYATSGPKYDYTTGPDGKRYAVGGSVDIDVSPIQGDPEATLRKATIVRAAAMAVSSPSPADQQVAAMASRMAAEALADIRAENSFSGYGEQDEVGSLFDALA